MSTCCTASLPILLAPHQASCRSSKALPPSSLCNRAQQVTRGVIERRNKIALATAGRRWGVRAFSRYVCFNVKGSTHDARQCGGICWPCTAPQLGLKAELPAKLYTVCTHSKAPSEQARHKAMRGYDGRLCKVAQTSNNYYRVRQSTRHTADLRGTLLAGALACSTLAAPHD